MDLFWMGQVLLLFNAVPSECSLKTDCKSLYNGVYFMQNCYLFGGTGSWENRMDYCNLLGGDKYVSYLAHPLTSQIISIFQKIWSAQHTNFYSALRWLWLGGRDAYSGSDPTKAFWKFRYYTTKLKSIDLPITQLYFVSSLGISSDQYQHTDSALAHCWGYSSVYEMQRCSTPIAAVGPAVCQINDRVRNFERMANNQKINRAPFLQTMAVKSQMKCQHECIKHLLCFGYNIGPETSGTRQCELLAWIVEDVGDEHIDDVAGWQHFQRSL